MNGRSIRWFPLTLFALLAALTFWLDYKVELSAKNNDRKLSHEPDFFVDEFRASSLDQNGMLRQKLSALKLLHYPDDDSTELLKPQLTVYTPGRADVSMTSETATISKNGDDLYLHQKVLLKKLRYQGENGFEVATEYLHVNPDHHLADTDKPVVITDPEMEIHAVGLKYNDQTRVLQLLSQVKGTYEKTR